MDTNDNNYKVLGEGDYMVEEWEAEMWAMNDIGRILREAEEADHDMSWESLADRLWPLNLEPHQARRIESCCVCDFLANHPAVDIDVEAWGGESPGRGGHYIRVKVQADKLPEVSAAVEALASALDAYWKSVQATGTDSDASNPQ